MIGYLSGKLFEGFKDGKVLIGVGGSEGVIGYQASVPSSAPYQDLLPGEAVRFFIYTHVREDALDLYAFQSIEEKDFFLLLLSVNGIGPKGALSILSGARIDELASAILSGDTALLTRVPGVGKKTAERLIIELADPIKKRGQFQKAAQGAHPVAPSFERDALEALVGLGFRAADVQRALERVQADPSTALLKSEDMVKRALAELRN